MRGDTARSPSTIATRLGAGATLEGPAVIEERESTVVVSAVARIRVDDASNVIVEVPPVA